MQLINSENILKLLYSYNPWWSTGIIQKEFDKPMRRFAYYEANKIIFHKDIRRSVILSGARRTGKTTIMYQMISKLLNQGVPAKNLLFVSYDHPLLKMCSIQEMIDIYRQNVSADEVVYLFFDEVQYATNWDSWMKIIYDTMPSIRIIATGSASPALEDKISESGLGRWTIVPVPTLSFYEYCELLEISVGGLPKHIKPTQMYLLSKQEQTEIFMKLGKLQVHFLRYLQVGGFPELALSQDNIFAQRMLREDIVDKALKRDLPAVYGIRNIADIEKVFLYLCYISSNVVNIEAVTKELNGVTRATVVKYLEYLKNANLIYMSEQLNLGGKKVLKAKNKIYISDAAIRNAVLLNDDITSNSEELGIVVETAVFKHVKAFYYNQSAKVGYFRDIVNNKTKEIDVVVELSRATTILIEVKYRENSTIKEDDAVIAMGSPVHPGIVITKNETDFGLYNYTNTKIYKIPACAFLYLLGHVEKQTYKDNIIEHSRDIIK